jgi:hypothetical protein
LLTNFNGEQLAEAFNWAALTCKGWPTLADITEPIFSDEFAVDLGWLLAGLRAHKAAWQDTEPIFAESYRKPGAARDEWTQGDLISPAKAAPAIPPRLMDALETLGAGRVSDGLVEMIRHPAAGCHYVDFAESGKIKFQIERNFKAAWMAARRRELAGKDAR